MPTYDITSPDGKTYEVTAPDGATQEQVLQYVQQQHTAAPSPAPQALAGPQPSFIDKAVGSPVGRLAHDALLQPMEGLANIAFGSGMSNLSRPVEQAYEDSLARNRNTPGYAKARAEADAVRGKRGSGLSDQLVAPLLPALTGAMGAPGGFDAMNANADTQTSAQRGYQQRHPVLSMGAGLAGGLLMTPSAAAPAAGTSMFRAPLPAMKPSAIPTIADLKSAAHAAYDRVDNAGHIISDTAVGRMVSDLKSKLASEGIDKTLHPNALAAYSRMAETQGNPVTFKGMDTLRKVASDSIGASSLNKADQRMGYIVQDHIDDFIDNLKPTDLIGATDPKQAIADLAEARDAWSRASQASTIQKQIDKAGIKANANYSQSGYENALRRQFTSLALNDKAMARLSPELREAVKDVSKGGKLGNLLRFVGKYAPHGPVATAAGMTAGYLTGGVEGGGIGALTVPAIGEAARAGATKITKDAAQRALDTAALGQRPPPTAYQPALQRPMLPGANSLPYGLPLLLSPQQQTQ